MHLKHLATMLMKRCCIDSAAQLIEDTAKSNTLRTAVRLLMKCKLNDCCFETKVLLQHVVQLGLSKYEMQKRAKRTNYQAYT